MYGTVARFRVKPGKADDLRSLMNGREYQTIPGLKSTYVYQMDSDSDEFYLAVAFESKDAYWKNAQSPEQNDRYTRMRELMTADPEWHDGEIVYS